MTCAFVNPTSGYRTFSRLVSLRTRSSILTSTAVSLATFAHHLASRLVGAQTLERRRAQLSRAGPLHELELCHEPGLHEVRLSGRRAQVKRALRLLERLHQRRQLLKHRVAETCANLARVHKLLVLCVIADEQRPRIASPLALTLQPAPDDQLLAMVVLHLYPRAAATAGLVLGIELLRHHPFQARLGAGFEHRLAPALFPRRRLP